MTYVRGREAAVTLSGPGAAVRRSGDGRARRPAGELPPYVAELTDPDPVGGVRWRPTSEEHSGTCSNCLERLASEAVEHCLERHRVPAYHRGDGVAVDGGGQS